MDQKLSPELCIFDDFDPEIERQTEHYNKQYKRISVEQIVDRIQHLDEYLEDAIQTDTSWYGFYYGGFADQIAGKRILELGCGNGLNALIMAAKGAQVVAVDISSESKRILTEAVEQLGFDQQRIQSFHGDFRKLDFSQHGPFDLIVGKAFLHHLTTEQELKYLAKIARLLTPAGEARFFEPAENLELVDKLRWMIPMGRRPSSLRRAAFAQWRRLDPHPERSNSSRAYLETAGQYFRETMVIPIGSLERFHRLLPRGSFERAYRRWAHRMDRRMPRWFRHSFARSQTLVYRQPIHSSVV